MKLLLLLFLLCLVSCGERESNVSPKIQGSVSSVRVGEFLSFAPTANDSDGDVLTFSISGNPQWTEFDSDSGLLSGTPTTNDLGSVYSIEISVSDGALKDSIYFDLTVTEPIFFFKVALNTLDPHRDMEVELIGCLFSDADSECVEQEEIVSIEENGVFPFQAGLEAGSLFSLRIKRDPGRQDCFLEKEQGLVGSIDEVIAITCINDESYPLFDLKNLHNMRLTMDLQEWNAFVLDIGRSNYDRDANAGGRLTKVSQVYRKVNFEYLDDLTNVLFKVDNVGFKMKGSTSRQWPEYYESQDGIQIVKPKRFSFSLKFDEEFDEDESVYSCIDNSGNPAAVSGFPCNGRVGKNLLDIPDNDGRKFLGLEKLIFRFNRDDPSYQRELLAHDILNTTGVPAARAAHGRVQLRLVGDGSFNGVELPVEFNLGVFQMIEPIDKIFLKRFFGKNGYLFKNGIYAYLNDSFESLWNCKAYEDSPVFLDSEFCQIGVEKSDPVSPEEWLGSSYLDPEYANSDINGEGFTSQFKPYKPRYDLKTKKSKIETGRSLLKNFITFVQSKPTAALLAEEFDVPGFIKAQAVEVVIGAADHYVRSGNNYYLYLSPILNKWVYIPTDFDLVFFDSLSSGPPIYKDLVDTYIFPREGRDDWASKNIGPNADALLWDIVFSDESNMSLLYKEVRSILDDHMQWDLLQSTLSERNMLVKNAILNTDAGLPEGCGFIYNEASIDGNEESDFCDASEISIRQFILSRRETLYQELDERGF